MSEQPHCFIQREEHIAWINLSHGPVNALSRTMVDQLESGLDELSGDRDLAAVFVRSRLDDTFCAGADLKERRSMDDEDVKVFVKRLREQLWRLSNLSSATVALINGHALGGGLELALACDMRYASEKAVCGLPEVRLGLIPGGGGTQRLARLIGPGDAKEMILTGKQYNARQCYELGLFNRLLSPGNLLDEARKLGRLLADNSTPAMALAKKAVDRGLDRDLSDGLDVEWECYLDTFKFEDRDEALDEFNEDSD